MKGHDQRRVQALQKAKMSHPYIVTDKRICSGSPVIKGTRTRVVDIAIEYEYLNHTPNEIINAHPNLKPEQVHDALSYYYENRSHLDQETKKTNNSFNNSEEFGGSPDYHTSLSRIG